MTLPASGQISLLDIATQFGGTAPHSLSKYYRGGPLVPNIAANNAIPTSGMIKTSDFYSATGGGVDVSQAQYLTYSPAPPGTTTMGIRCGNDGRIYRRDGATGGAWVDAGAWKLSVQAASNFEASFTSWGLFFPSASGFSSLGTYDTTLNLGTTREWTVTYNNGGAPPAEASCTGGLAIRRVGETYWTGVSTSAAWYA